MAPTKTSMLSAPNKGLDKGDAKLGNREEATDVEGQRIRRVDGGGRVEGQVVDWTHGAEEGQQPVSEGKPSEPEEKVDLLSRSRRARQSSVNVC